MIEEKRPLNANHLKIIALIAMTIDHIGWAFLDLKSPIGFISHIIGRVTIVIICYLLYEGFMYTRNVNKYLLRLFIFAVISHIPFYYFLTGVIPTTLPELLQSFTKTSVMWSLFLALLSLRVWIEKRLSKLLRFILILIICWLSYYGDWLFMPTVFVLMFYWFRDNRKKQMAAFALSALPLILLRPINMLTDGNTYPAIEYLWALFQAGMLLAIPLLLVYRSQRLRSGWFKWVFYLYYPLHLVIIAIIWHG